MYTKEQVREALLEGTRDAYQMGARQALRSASTALEELPETATLRDVQGALAEIRVTFEGMDNREVEFPWRCSTCR